MLEPLTLDTLSHGSLRVPTGGLVHLQFRRFAGCPICSLHLRSFANGLTRLEAAGVETVAFFHSSAETMRPFHGDLPFPVVPDPERRWYGRFGVERSLVSALHPKAMWAAVQGLVRAPSHLLRGEGGKDGLPADFLVGPKGEVLAEHYGRHPDDHWELQEVVDLALAEAARGARE
jgi:peroxiredoxin